MARLRLGVLISGRGSNLNVLIEHCAQMAYPAEIVTVISNSPDAPGLDCAKRAGIKTSVIDHRNFSSRKTFGAALTETLEKDNVELICLAGFMRILEDQFVQHWRDRLINIHPSLLPAFKGLKTHEEALRRGVKFSGCTVHFVRAEMDSGPIITQAVVPVLPKDTPESLGRRVLKAEHQIYPMAVRMIAEKLIMVQDEIVVIKGIRCPDLIILNPEGIN